MPTNEISAPFYLRVKINTGVARHVHRIYFETGTTVDTVGLDPIRYRVKGVGAANPVEVRDLVYQVWHRARDSAPTGSVLEGIELWATQPGANTFLAYNPLPEVVPVFNGAQVASSYITLVYEAANRQKWRQTFFDAKEPRPQRFPFVEPPSADNGSLEWYMLKSDVPFATQDGWPLVRGISVNVGYNRSLARRYGRTVSP